MDRRTDANGITGNHVRASTQRPGATVVGRSELWSRLFRSGVCGLCLVERARSMERTAFPSQQHRFSYHAIRDRAAGSWDARCGAVHRAVVLGDLDLRDHPVSGRWAGAAVDFVSDRLSALYDSVAGHRLLPIDVSASIVGFTIGGERSGLARDSHGARGESAGSPELYAQCGRSLQRNPLSAFSPRRSGRLRVFGRAEYVEEERVGFRERPDRDCDKRSASCGHRYAELLLRTERGFRSGSLGAWAGFLRAGFSWGPAHP